LALGPDDDELREALTVMRTMFEDIAAQGGRRADWFTAKERRETARRLRDLAECRNDRTLRMWLARVADTWDEVFALGRVSKAWTGRTM